MWKFYGGSSDKMVGQTNFRSGGESMKLVRVTLAMISFWFFFFAIWSITPDEAVKCVLSGFIFILAILVSYMME